MTDDMKPFRFKRAYFKVDGRTHTLEISMKDFDEGRAKEIIMAEAAKIEAVTTKGKR